MEIGKISGAPASGASVSDVSDWVAVAGYYNTPPMELQFNTTLGDGLPQLSIGLGPLVGSPLWPRFVDWGDGTLEELVSNPQTHTYSTGGVYDVKLFGYGVLGAQNDFQTKLVKINKWVDTIELLSLSNCGQLTQINDSNPAIINSGAGILLLGNCTILSVTSGINDWDVSSLNTLNSAFTNSSLFNGDISNWVVSGVSQFSSVFDGALSFNQDISSWDVSSGSIFGNMFYNASSFDQNLGAWQFKNNAIGSFFFANSGMSDANVALCLEGWDSIGQGTGVDMTNMFGTAAVGGGPRTLNESTYPDAKTAYDNLIATYSWDFTNAFNWVSPSLLFLDTYPNAAAAYSVRLLRAGYVGSAMRVRRAVTPFDEQDIGFTPGGDLDETAIVAFGGSDELRVSKWYDQSGQSKDVEQITPTAQPQIYNGVSVVQDNGRAALQLSGAQGLNCSTNTRTTQGPSTVIQVRNVPKQTGFQQPVGFYRVQRHVIERVGQPTYDDVSIGTAWANGEYLRYPNANVTTQLLHISSWNGSAQTGGRDLIQLFENGGAAESFLVGTGGFGVPVSGDNSIGWRHATSSQGCTGYFQEVIIYPSDESFYRVDMANNIMTHFNIP